MDIIYMLSYVNEYTRHMHHLNHIKFQWIPHGINALKLNSSTLQSSNPPFLSQSFCWGIPRKISPSAFTRPMGIKRPQLQVPSLVLTQPASMPKKTSVWWQPAHQKCPPQILLAKKTTANLLKIFTNWNAEFVCKFPYIFCSPKKSHWSHVLQLRLLENPAHRKEIVFANFFCVAKVCGTS